MPENKPSEISGEASSCIDRCVDRFREKITRLSVYYASIDVRNAGKNPVPVNQGHVSDANCYLLDEQAL